LEVEGLIPSREICSWRSAVGDQTPAPREGEIIVLTFHIHRGISFPLSDFLSAVLRHFRVQPFHLTPNSIVILSGFAALCEGYLGVRPQLDLFRYYYQIKRITLSSGGPLQRCGSVAFKIRRNRVFPDIAGHESVKGWTSSYFYCKDVPKAGHNVGWPAFVDGAAKPTPSWTEAAPHPLSPELIRLRRRIEKLMEKGLTGFDLVYCWFVNRIQPLQHHERLMHEYSENVDDDLRVSKTDLPPCIFDSHIKLMTKLRTEEDKERGWVPSLEMYTQGKCPSVSFVCLLSLGGECIYPP
jgi:hypothetical protein